jgi:uncharacterized protein
VKRCFALIALGALHFTFLWHGDIIFLYGIFGLLLIPFFFRADRTLKIWTRIVFITSSTLVLLVGALVYIAERYLPTESFQAPMESKLDSVLVNGTFLEAIPARLEIWVYGITTGVFLQGGLAFAAFLLGLRMSRSNFLSSPMDAKKNSTLMKTGFFIGAPIQIVAAIALVRNEQTAESSEAIYLISLFTSFIAAPLMSIFYISVFRKMVEDKPKYVTWMVPAGKMSLTVYISQSVITSLAFGPWGLGLFQKLETWEVVLFAFGIWFALVFLAKIWLQKYDQGPLEKMVNTLTRNR